MPRVAMLSLHSSPLAQPGAGDGGGMSVYVHELATALSRAGVDVDVLTRADHPEQPPVVELGPGLRVVHLDAGPRRSLSHADLVELVDPMVAAASSYLADSTVDVLHANYWLSGAVAHRLKHEHALPMITTFHTLALAKTDVGIFEDPPSRADVERDVVRCADVILASTGDERRELVRRYGAAEERVEVVAPGVDHSTFSPGDADAARRRLGLAGRRVLLCVGRIQALKGFDLAIRAVAELQDANVTLLVVGGPSGPDGERELDRLRALTDELDLIDQVTFVAPRPHDALAVYYRAADACLVPSRTESFGLVALEAAACARPVVAADVGGLRTIVHDGETGFLVGSRSPAAFAGAVERVLDDPVLAARLGEGASARAIGYTWTLAAARVRRLVADLGARAPVECR